VTRRPGEGRIGRKENDPDKNREAIVTISLPRVSLSRVGDGSGTGLVAQYDLPGATGGGLATHTGGDPLDFTASLQEGFDMLFQVFSAADRRFLFRFARHNYSFS